MPDTNRLHFANFFDTFSDPAGNMLPKEMAFNSDGRLVYKDAEGNIQPLPSYADYNPNVITLTQTAKTATIGVGVEGDYSASVVQSIPKQLTIVATGIHNRQAIIQYNASNAVKDVIPLPDYFCKVGAYADTFNALNGLLTENVEKTTISAQPARTANTNTATFKVKLLSSTSVETSFGLPLTVEANANNASYVNYMYVGADNYLYIIKSLATPDLVLPFMVFNGKLTPSIKRYPTTYLFFDTGDIFTIGTYRRMLTTSTAPTFELITSGEPYTISKILRGHRVANDTIEYANITIDAGLKSVAGLDSTSYYDIIVLTTEVGTQPTINYQIIDGSNPFLSYMYSLMKYMSDNNGNILNKMGYTGSAGSGFVGSAGYMGSRGYSGSVGFVGSTGYVGSFGYTGSQGIQGLIGYIGSKGYSGSVGYVGSAGYGGSFGYTGSASTVIGYTGSQGTQGTTGYVGSQGTQGNLGNTGSTGAGYTGSTGYIGSKGYTGSSGYTGSFGYTGSASTTIGYTGSIGIGYTGSASTVIGYSGSRGYSGSVGYTGSTGITSLSYDGLTDVTISTPTAGHIVRYSGSNWVNTSPIYVGSVAPSNPYHGMIWMNPTSIV